MFGNMKKDEFKLYSELVILARFLYYLNCAKVEDAPDLRRHGWSRSELLQTRDNAEDGVSSAFPQGKQNWYIITEFISNCW